MNTMILGVFLLGLSAVKNLINISFNELLSLLSRVFEAIYGHEHDFQEMAQTVFWLESHGHSGTNKLIDDNTITFVAIHELAHLMTKEIGHVPTFWDNMKYLLDVGIKLGVYDYVDYGDTPVKYCGTKITDTPLDK
mgnify:CR=1 FL=1